MSVTLDGTVVGEATFDTLSQMMPMLALVIAFSIIQVIIRTVRR
jgi:uncharacterized membrane protein YcaP (DUF421 family)